MRGTGHRHGSNGASRGVRHRRPATKGRGGAVDLARGQIVELRSTGRPFRLRSGQAKARSFPQKSICQTALVTNEIFFHSAQFSDTLFGQRKSEMFRSRSVVSMFLVPAFLVPVFLLFAGVCST